MICPTDETFTAFTAGLLLEDERAALEEHAAGCALCRASVVALAGVLPSERDGLQLGAEGAAIGRYRILGTIGEGAMGVVLRGHDPVLDREVAIKMSRAFGATPEQRDRSIREAQALARLDHPNVVRVFDAGTAGSEVFVAMEYVAGASLARWNDGTRSRAEKLEVLAGVGRGLAAVHTAGLVHRDIKPENILVRDNGQGVLVDFGLARAEAMPGATGSGLAGTLRYLAPEVRAGAPASAKSDQFAWWTVVGEVVGEVPALARGLAPNPDARFPTMLEATAALMPRRRRASWVAAIAIVIAGAVAASMMSRGADRCASAVGERWQAQRFPVGVSLTAAGADAPRILASLDARAARTAVLQRETCARGDDPIAQRQRLCISETWHEATLDLRGLVDPDPKLVRAAVDELVLVLPVDRCATGALPGTPAPPPPARRAQADELEQALREINHGAEATPKVQLERLHALQPRLAALADPAFDAMWHSALASQLVRASDLRGAADELEATVKSAELAGDDDARVRALVNIVRLAGDDPSSTAPLLEERAEAAAARLANPGILAELHFAEGSVRYARGDVPAGIAKLEQARAEYAAIAIDVHDQQVVIEQNLGGMLQSAGRLDDAQVALDRAFELARRRYGVMSPRTLVVRGARATNLLDRDQLPAARAELAIVATGLARTFGPASPPLAQAQGYLCECDLQTHGAGTASCDTALATAEQVFGADNPQLVWFLVMVGQARTLAGADAIAPLERALAISAHGSVMPSDHALAAGSLALALAGAHRDPVRAARLAAEAKRALAALHDQPKLQEALAAAFPGP